MYFSRGHNYSTVYSYYVTELILLTDSTFVENNYKVQSKKEWKNYKKYNPERREGLISRDDKFFRFTELVDGNKSEKIRYAKVTNQTISFYLKNDNESFDKVYTMRRK